PPARGHEEDDGAGRHPSRLDAHRRDLRHELQAHAGAQLEVRLLLRARPDGPAHRNRLPLLQTPRLALVLARLAPDGDELVLTGLVVLDQLVAAQLGPQVMPFVWTGGAELVG